MGRNKTKIDPDDTMQYRKEDGGVYVRCGATKQKLEAGFYDVVYTGREYGLKAKEAVSDDLIDLPGTVADEIFTDIDKFMATSGPYETYGLTHKRGYLFYGPPGTGKTSLGMMLARRFIERVGGIVMYAGNHQTFYHGVSIMRDVEPGRPSMYLIEEADAVVNNTACLSILDGELSIQNAVFIAMTNYKEELPPRIANRPGRFDRVALVKAPPKEVQVEFLRRVGLRGMSGEQSLATANKIVTSLEGLQMSMAHLREAFISHVLMGVSLLELRKRFEIMSGVRSDQSFDEEDEDREQLIYDAKNWDPNEE